MLSRLEERLGTIRVKIRLGRRTVLPKSRPSSKLEFQATLSTSKQLYKNLGITNSMRWGFYFRKASATADRLVDLCSKTRKKSPHRGTKKYSIRRSLSPTTVLYSFTDRAVSTTRFPILVRCLFSIVTLDRLGIKSFSPLAQPTVVGLDPDVPTDLILDSSNDSPVAIDTESDVPEELDLDIGSVHGHIDTAADVQAKDDGRKKAEAIEKTLGAEARQRTKFFLESYKDSDINPSGLGLQLQLCPNSQNTTFSLSSLVNPELATTTAIDTRRFRHLQWCPYECTLIRLNGVQYKSKASLTRDLKFTTRQEAELFMVRMMQMTAPIFIARTK